MDILNTLLTNKISIPSESKYAAIIGENPSFGARSPILWNKAYFNYKYGIKMYPFDVANIEALNKLISFLNQDINFIGGAIAVPYKTKLAEILGKNLTNETSKIKAVNCLYRDTAGNLIGTNTDGEAALISLIKNKFSFDQKKILVLGNGGVAKAVIAYISTALDKSGELIVSRRTPNKDEINKEENTTYVGWKDFPYELHKFDLIINCTSIGFGDNKDDSPLDLEEVKALNKKVLVYDVIYQPNPTRLLKMSSDIGLKVLSGIEMNLEQAVIAFNYANHFIPDISNSETRNFMLT